MSYAITLNDENRVFEPAPKGLHNAVCVDFVNLGLVTQTFEGNTTTKPMFRLVWQIDKLMESGRRFSVSKRYTASLHERATFRKDLEEWNDGKYTKEELSAIAADIEGYVLGKPATLRIVHNPGKDRDGNDTTWANVNTIMPLQEGAVALQPLEYVRVEDRDGYVAPEKVNTNSNSARAANLGNGYANGNGNGAVTPNEPVIKSAPATGPITVEQAGQLVTMAIQTWGAIKSASELTKWLGCEYSELTSDQAAQKIGELRTMKPTPAAIEEDNDNPFELD